jgi:predicted TIM-barrel fold metal-dependent hydrolase
MGGYNWSVGIEVGRTRSNTVLEICSTSTDLRRLRDAIGAVGAERVLFGTDSTLFAPEYTLGAVEDMNVTPEELRLVMGENAKKLFRFVA